MNQKMWFWTVVSLMGASVALATELTPPEQPFNVRYVCQSLGGVKPSLRIIATEYAMPADPAQPKPADEAVTEVDGQVEAPAVQVTFGGECRQFAPRRSLCSIDVSGENFSLTATLNTSSPSRIFNASYAGAAGSQAVVCTF